MLAVLQNVVLAQKPAAKLIRVSQRARTSGRIDPGEMDISQQCYQRVVRPTRPAEESSLLSVR